MVTLLIRSGVACRVAVPVIVKKARIAIHAIQTQKRKPPV